MRKTTRRRSWGQIEPEPRRWLGIIDRMGPEINIDGDGHGENSDMVDTGRDWNHRSPSLRSEFVIPTTSTRSLTIPAEETSVANGLEGRHWQRHSSSDTTRSATARSISTNHSNLNLDLPASRASGGKREKLKTLKENAVNALRHNGNSAGKGKGKGKDNSRSQSHSPAAGGVGSSEGDENVDGRAEDEDKASSKSNNAASPRRQSLSSKLAHPRTALKASLAHIVAGKLSTLNDPYIPQEAEVEFVEAHEERNEALKDGCMEDVEDAEKRIEGLHRQRRNMQVNWTIHRHVTNVTVAPTKQRIIEKPRKSDFIIRDESGNPIIEFENGGERIDYVKWLGQVRPPSPTMSFLSFFYSTRKLQFLPSYNSLGSHVEKTCRFVDFRPCMILNIWDPIIVPSVRDPRLYGPIYRLP